MEYRHVEEVKFWQGKDYTADLKHFAPEPGDPNSFRDFRVQSADETRQLIADTKKAVAGVEKLLSELHIDQGHGLSRSDILKMESNPSLSKADRQSIDILLSGEKTIEDLIPSGRREWGVDSVQAPARPGDPVPKTNSQPDERLSQYDHYMNDKSVTPETVHAIKTSLEGAGMAVRVLDDPDFFINNFMEKLHLDPAKDSLTPKAVWTALSDGKLLGQLRDDQVKFLTLVQEGQRQMFKDLDRGIYSTTPDGGITVDRADISFDRQQLKCLAERWALAVASDKSVTRVVDAINHRTPETLTKQQFLTKFEILNDPSLESYRHELGRYSELYKDRH